MAITIDTKRPGEVSLSSDQRLPKPIRDLDLGCIRFKLLSPESFVDWADEDAKVVEAEYRKFLALHFMHPEEAIVPDSAVDVFWHQHILDTEKYAADCQNIFGKFVHHFPYLGMRGEEDAEDLRISFEHTLARYREAFGEPPEKCWVVRADCGCTGCFVGGSSGCGSS